MRLSCNDDMQKISAHIGREESNLTKGFLSLGISCAGMFKILLISGAPIDIATGQSVAGVMHAVSILSTPMAVIAGFGYEESYDYWFRSHFNIDIRQYHVTSYELFCRWTFWGAAVGMLSMSFVIPLDWGIGIQRWPAPMIIGSTIGGFIGNLYAIYSAYYHFKKNNNYLKIAFDDKAGEVAQEEAFMTLMRTREPGESVDDLVHKIKNGGHHKKEKGRRGKKGVDQLGDSDWGKQE